MIVLTASDLARMPAALLEELQRFLFSNVDAREHDVVYEQYDVFEAPLYGEEQIFAESERGPAKHVVDITEEQARALIANLSAKSIDSLRLFTTQQGVPLDDIVGEGKAYVSFTDLKRSFVGAVNRRLRTVTRNRSAVLFRKPQADELDGRAGIAVRPQTSEALALVFQKEMRVQGDAAFPDELDAAET